ncbi:MAG: twin-arginine translocase TatA/TatE family subunit [Candidatus Lernaella stagnicola]|nr:twin-arginine translocase TatA/TatE family subunit [Candidatus Lernaella stagnicola]
MFGLGSSEILLIIVAIVILLAMGKLPDVARKAGGAYRAYRKVDDDLRTMRDPTKIIDILTEDHSVTEKKDAPNDTRKA